MAKNTETKIYNQEIEILGDVIGYQFSNTKNGKRTIIHSINLIDENTGTLEYKGRIVKVVRKYPEYKNKLECMYKLWTSIEEVR